MTKFTAEEKLAAVQSYLEGVGGYDAVGASHGCSRIYDTDLGYTIQAQWCGSIYKVPMQVTLHSLN